MPEKPGISRVWTFLSDWVESRLHLRPEKDSALDLGSSDYRWRTIYTSTAIGARVYNGGAFTHNSSGNWLSITFDSERFDTDGIHSTSSNAERLTCVTPGTYLITGTALWTASGDGTARGLRIMVGSTRIASEMRALPSTNIAPGITISAIYQLTAGQYVTLDAYQNTGGSLDIVASGDYSPAFSMVRIP